MRQPPTGIAHSCAFRPAARRRAAGITRERMQPQAPRSPRRPLPPRHAGNGPSRRDGRPPHVLTRPGCHGVRPAVGAAARRLSRRPRPAARPTPRTRRGPQTLRTPDATTDGWDDGEPPNPHAGRGAGEGNMAGKPPGDDRLRRGHPGRRPDFPPPAPVARSRHSAHAVPPATPSTGPVLPAGGQDDGHPDGRPPDARRIGSDRTVERPRAACCAGLRTVSWCRRCGSPNERPSPYPPTPAAHRLTRVAIGACCSRFRR
ncbi:hypothetical protein SUDANB99_05868 [Streptomyces sp. enrichment culture]